MHLLPDQTRNRVCGCAVVVVGFFWFCQQILLNFYNRVTMLAAEIQFIDEKKNHVTVFFHSLENTLFLFPHGMKDCPLPYWKVVVGTNKSAQNWTEDLLFFSCTVQTQHTSKDGYGALEYVDKSKPDWKQIFKIWNWNVAVCL